MLEERPERQFRLVTEADTALQWAAQKALETGHLAHPPASDLEMRDKNGPT